MYAASLILLAAEANVLRRKPSGFGRNFRDVWTQIDIISDIKIWLNILLVMLMPSHSHSVTLDHISASHCPKLLPGLFPWSTVLK